MAQGFDPAAATAAYLSALTPLEHAKAQAYTQGGHWLLLWGALVSVLVGWLILRSGILVRVRARVEAGGPRAALAGAAVVVVAGGVEFVLGRPWASSARGSPIAVAHSSKRTSPPWSPSPFRPLCWLSSVSS